MQHPMATRNNLLIVHSYVLWTAEPLAAQVGRVLPLKDKVCLVTELRKLRKRSSSSGKDSPLDILNIATDCHSVLSEVVGKPVSREHTPGT